MLSLAPWHDIITLHVSITNNNNCSSGELYVIVEYCHFGNLRSYLLKHKEEFRDVMEDAMDAATEKRREAAREAAANKPYYINKAQIENTADLVGPPLTTKNLICWSFQVARGMEYLASKKVCITTHTVNRGKNEIPCVVLYL